MPEPGSAKGRAMLHHLLLRSLVFAGPLLAVVCIRAAASTSVVALDILVLGFALVCALLPDSHFGLPLVAFLGIDWVMSVDNSPTPWAIGAALSLVVFHTAMAASSVAPPAAPWTSAMRRRWTQRSLMLAAGVGPVWAITAATHSDEPVGSPALIVLALLVLSAALLWVRYGGLDLDPPSDDKHRGRLSR